MGGGGLIGGWGEWVRGHGIGVVGFGLCGPVCRAC